MCYSEGAMAHIAIEQRFNTVDTEIELEKRTLRYNNLSNAQLYMSINEQFAEILKDFAHYTQKNFGDPTEAYYRSSKYLLRFFKAIAEITSQKSNRLNLKKSGQPSINH